MTVLDSGAGCTLSDLRVALTGRGLDVVDVHLEEAGGEGPARLALAEHDGHTAEGIDERLEPFPVDDGEMVDVVGNMALVRAFCGLGREHMRFDQTVQHELHARRMSLLYLMLGGRSDGRAGVAE